MLVSKSIPNMFAGVSQQAATLRHPTQAELMDNAYPSISSGTRKRFPTKHKAKIKNTTASDAFVHIINKDKNNRFVVVITNGALEVFNAETGAAHTVNFPDGVAYLTSTTPRSDFVAMTAVDYTFISNKTITAAMTAATAAGAIAATHQQFSALPAAPAVGNIYRVEGTPDSNFDDYYVKWDGAVYVEWIKPGVKYQFDAATLPWKLIKTGATTWEFRKNTWDDRLVGDDISNPQPSFIGRSIRDIFFHRGRLGFIADENVILSRAGGPFNFWAESATVVADSDPIDKSVSHTKASILTSVVPFNKAMMLFSDLTQFQFTGGQILTPKSPSIDPATEYESSSTCRPISSGSALYFSAEGENSTAIREYAVDEDTVSNDAQDITAHVPTYIPKGVFRIASSTKEDVLFVLSTSERNKVWVYKFFWEDKDGTQSKVQSAWCRFVFDAADTVLGMEFINDACVLVIQRADGIYLERMSLEANAVDSDLGFLVHLDRRVELTGVYDAANDRTDWTLPYADSGSFTVVLGTAFGVDKGNSLNTTRPTSSTIRALGNWSAGTCYIGRNYEMRYRFSTIYQRDQNNVAVTNGKLKLKRMYVNFKDSGYFRAEVTPKGRSMYTYEFTGKYVGSAVVDATSIETGTFNFPIGCENTLATIDIVSDSYLPCFLQSATWEGEFTIRSQRQ